MNWNNINLKDAYERDQNILDGYNFDMLLLEVSTNIKDTEINEKTISAHFEEQLKMKMRSAREVFKVNLENITKDAQEYAAIE